MEEELELRRAVVFAVLMANGMGLLGKSPAYIREKWLSVKESHEPEGLLDMENMGKVREWRGKWGKLPI